MFLITEFTFIIIACYLSPENSIWGRNSDQFFAHLVSEVYTYSYADSVYLCGDFNARIGNKSDHIDNIDDIPPRRNIDDVINAHGHSLLDFVLDTKLCILNGRLSPEHDNYTFLSSRGRSVVDYVITTHEGIDMCKQFKVITCNKLIEENKLQSLINSKSKPPDHSILSLEFMYSYGYNINNSTMEQKSTNSISKPIQQDCNILLNNKMYNFNSRPENFLKSENWKQKITTIVQQLENNIDNQNELDSVFNNLCKSLFSELDNVLKFKTIGNKKTRKYFKSHKPYWDEELSNKWKLMREKEQLFTKYKGRYKFIKQKLLCEFKDHQHTFDKILRKKERAYNREQILSFDEINPNNPREFWDKLKNLGPKRKTSIPIKARKGNEIITDEKEVMNIWKEDFEKLYNCPVDHEDEFHNDIKRKKQLNEQCFDENEEINNSLTIEEVKLAVNKLKVGKACGVDCIQNELLKQEELLTVLWKLLCLCFDKSIVPSIWLKAIISPIPKCATKDPYTPLNYRGISLLSCVSKLYTSILNNRIMNYCEDNSLLEDEQNGFRKNRSCTDHIFSLNSIIKNRINNKESTFCAFIDFEKAFDWVNRDLLLYRLQQYNINGKVYKAIQKLYSNTWSCIRLNSLYTEFFNTKSGVRQGDNLSPTLFNIFINDLIREIKQLNIGVNIDNIIISILLYADDIVLIAKNERDLQTLITCVSEWCMKWKLKINLGKTKIVHFRPKKFKQTEFQFMYQDKPLETVSSYKYLGIIFDEHLNFNKCTEILSESAGRALGSVISKFKKLQDCTFKTFTKLYDTGLTPILDYSAGVWGYNDRKPINDIQNRAIRYFLGVHKFTPIIGLEAEMGWDHSNIRRFKWMLLLWNRLTMMDINRLTRKVFEYDYKINSNNWCTEINTILKNINQEIIFCRKTPCNINHSIEELRRNYENTWKINIMNKAKLRTYVLFKTSYTTETYLKLNLVKWERSTLAQFRLGVLPLEIETGRYKRKKEENGSMRKLEVNERLCKMCSEIEVEDEIHFLLKCTKYNEDRNLLLNHATTLNQNFHSFPINEQLKFLMNNCIKYVARYLSDAWSKRKKCLFN